MPLNNTVRFTGGASQLFLFLETLLIGVANYYHKGTQK